MRCDIHMTDFVCATKNLMEVFYWNNKFRDVSILKRRGSGGIAPPQCRQVRKAVPGSLLVGTSAWGGERAVGLGAAGSSLYHSFCTSWKESLFFSGKFLAFVVFGENS